MIDISFEINGRRVDPRNMRDTLEAAMLTAVTNGIRQKLASCRCAEHGKPPTLKGKGRSLDTLNFEVSGCCDRLIADVKRRLGAR